jgi:hypothetical protein
VAAVAASVTAVLVHFAMYYGKLPVPLTSATGENPGVAAAVAICASVAVGTLLLKLAPEGNHDIS